MEAGERIRKLSHMSSAAEPSPVTAFESLAPVKLTGKQAAKKKSLLRQERRRNERRRENEPNSGPEPQATMNWPVVLWLGALHVGAIAAIWTFTWQAIILTVALHWLTGCVGITLGFHRLLTHGSFQTSKPVRWILGVIGGLAGEGSAIDWVANHRKHHALSDQPGDPHSPHDGPWWSHMFWLAYTLQGEERERHVRRWAPDLVKDKGLNWIAAMFLPSHFILGLILMGAGYALGGWPMAASFVVYGIFVRLVLVLHATWLVNSASHMWGYKNYETSDDSRNNWFVALVTYGEGWHNNHHAYPRMAPHGHKWWEFDLTYNIIRLMKVTGLAWNVVDYKQKTLGGEQR
jgi:stearoyl-CoA desaturase (delta-9 desaturase)